MATGSMLAAILVLAFVIFIHELGHFLVGKWCDVEVRTFSMGFGPTIWARRFGETEYRLAAIPFGGYVRMAGYEEEGGDPEDAPSDPSRGFTGKPLRQRAAIVLAGPLVNLLFAALLLVGAAMAYGVPRLTDEPVVGGVSAGMPAEAAGLLPDDLIVAVDGKPVPTWEDLLVRVTGSEGRTLLVEVSRPDGSRRTVELTPRLAPRLDAFGEEQSKAWQIGIHRGMRTEAVGPGEAVVEGLAQTWAFSTMILETVSRLFQGRVSAGDLGGPILIVREAGRQAQEGLQPLLVFMALISVNLGVINLLPIPVLDGGHLAFMSYEAVRGRPLSLRVREYALSVGMVLIGSMMIFVVFNDLIRIAAG